MLKIYAIILIAVFMFILLKPVIPYLEYMVRKDWIIEKFCINREKPEMQCNGKCHLEKQLSKEVDTSDDQSPDQPRQEKRVRLEYLIVNNEESTSLQALNLSVEGVQTSYSYQFISSIFRPPIKEYSLQV